MKRNLVLRSCMALLILVPFIATSQDYFAQYSASLSWKPISELKMELTPEIHLKDFKEFDEWLITYGLEYDILSYLEVGASIRLNTEYKDFEPIYSLRYSGDIVFKIPVSRFDFRLRGRYSNYAEYGDELDSYNAYRSRLKVEYDIRNCKITPNLFGELFYKPERFDISKIRYGFGLDWNLPKRNHIEAGYFFQTYPGRKKRVQVFEVNWSYSIKNRATK